MISMHEKMRQRRKKKRPNKIKPAKHKQANSILEENNNNNNNKNQNLWQVGTVDDSRSQTNDKKNLASRRRHRSERAGRASRGKQNDELQKCHETVETDGELREQSKQPIGNFGGWGTPRTIKVTDWELLGELREESK
jgi:hypothetical protein